jgi:myosin heavy subunit
MTRDRKRFLEIVDDRKRTEASVVIQKNWKRFSIRRNFQNLLQSRDEAAIVIQKNWKAWQAKNQYQNDLKRVVLIQSMVRMRVANKNFLQQKSAAVVIQTSWRRITARRNFVEDVQRVVRLQAHFRR